MLDCMICAAFGAAPVTQADNTAGFCDVAPAQDDKIADVLCLVVVLFTYHSSLPHIAAMVMQRYIGMRPTPRAWHQCMHIIGF